MESSAFLNSAGRIFPIGGGKMGISGASSEKMYKYN